jgi:hypothetical protein
MNRRSLGALAIVIIILMAIVATAGLDNLPRDVRKSIDTAAARLANDRKTFDQNREFVAGAIQNEAALFRTKAPVYRERLDKDSQCLADAANELATLQQLEKTNQRADADRARNGLSKLNTLRDRCSSDAASIRAEAERWIRYKHELPQRLTAMNASYQSLQSFDVDSAAAPAEKAMTDWPDKRSDLENRLNQLKAIKTQAEQTWQATARLREDAAANRVNDFDYGTFFQSADSIDQASRQLTEGTATLNALAGQLYTAWDKVLLDVDRDHDPPDKVRIVTTKFKDAALTGGETTSEEKWETVPGVRQKNADETLGMVVERKGAGKYDSEAERVVQPPAYARIAPPGQSNAYGFWSNGVWNWLPQYMILSHLLNTSRTPVTTGDFYAYQQARRSGQIFYGRNNEFRWGHSPRSTSGGVFGRVRDWAESQGRSTGSTGGWYKERPKTWGSGGFGSSQYRSRGTFSGSRFQSRGGFGSRSFSRGFGGAVRSFGRGRR